MSTVSLVAALPRRRPGQSLDRLALVVASSLGAAWVHQHHDPGALCPLRRLTGVPCPFCGSTTLFMEAGGGHWGQALAANPLTLAAAVVFLAAPAFGVDPLTTVARLPRPVLWFGGAGLCLLSWLWQLYRFGFLKI